MMARRSASILVAAFIAVAVAGSDRSVAGAEPAGYCSVESANLAGSGLELRREPETSDSGYIPSARAAQLAIDAIGHGSIMEVALVSILDPAGAIAAVPLWAVRIDGAPAIGGSGPAETNRGPLVPRCTVAFLDPRTGAVVFGFQSGPIPDLP
jgi:hypothetical protein